MSNETNETIEDIVAEMREGVVADGWMEQTLREFADRVEAAHKREIADEKRISDAVVQSLRDKKLEMAGEIAAKDAEIENLRAFVKEFADVLNDTKNYMCIGCNRRSCPGEYECPNTKKYCLLVDNAKKAIGDAKLIQHVELTKKET